ncbi:MAG: VOC family protein [Clostridiales bacterium]|nr:VOC family protein [Clostridiales bacterium]
MRINAIHHICLKASTPEEWEQALDFYGRVLGLAVRRQWPGGVMLCAGNSVIELYDSAEGPLPQGTIRHVALSTPDVDEYIAAVRAAGYPVTVEPKNVTLPSVPPCPIRIAFCQGPLGEKIEFFCERREEHPLKFYGTMICPNCVEAQEALREKGMDYEFIDITASTANLKEFLHLRDSSPAFDRVKEKGTIGIPCFRKEDGSVTFRLEDCLE